MRIELIYFDGCPHAERARANIHSALRLTGMRAEVIDREQGDPAVPAHVMEYGSPTVLVEGNDVTGAVNGGTAASCRAEGAPTVELIRAALEAVA